MFAKFQSRLKDGFLFQAIRFFRLRDSEERAARGFAVGLACNFYPTFGLGGFISGFLARLVGGNMVAGFIGGSTLALFWPLLFYVNIRVGSLFLRPPLVVDDLEDVTVQTVDALVWGQTFAIGSILNSIIAAVFAYFLFLFTYQRIRPKALRWLRGKVSARKALRLAKAEERHV